MDTVLADPTNWYEATLPLTERKRRGHFSTPPLLVERILDACGYTSDADLSAIRVLDPACGSGNFLAGAVRRLVDFGTCTRLSAQELATLIQRNIRGFDPDPISCVLAELQLHSIHSMPSSLHIHQADGLAFPWNSQPSVDLYLANPPYLATKNIDLSAYRSEQQGQSDSYLLFLDLGLRIVRPGGWLGLVLPDPLLARANAIRERTDLLKQCTIHHLWHLANVFPAYVGAVVIIAQKQPPQNMHQVSWVREKWGKIHDVTDHGHPGKLPQALFLRQSGAEFRYLLHSERGQAIERLRACLHETPRASRQFAPLGEFLSLRRGEELGRKSNHLVYAPASVTDHSLVGVSAWEQEHGYYPVLRGGCDVHAYATAFDGWWMKRQAIAKPLERYLAPKLLVVKSTGRLQAALDLQGHVALQTLYILRLREPTASTDELYFFLALLNSRLLQSYVYTLYTAYKWVQPQIEQHVLAQLPIPLATMDEKWRIIDNAKKLARACSEVGPVVEWGEHIQRMYEEQERAICVLYNAALPGADYFIDKGVNTYG